MALVGLSVWMMDGVYLHNAICSLTFNGVSISCAGFSFCFHLYLHAFMVVVWKYSRDMNYFAQCYICKWMLLFCFTSTPISWVRHLVFGGAKCYCIPPVFSATVPSGSKGSFLAAQGSDPSLLSPRLSHNWESHKNLSWKSYSGCVGGNGRKKNETAQRRVEMESRRGYWEIVFENLECLRLSWQPNLQKKSAASL